MGDEDDDTSYAAASGIHPELDSARVRNLLMDTARSTKFQEWNDLTALQAHCRQLEERLDRYKNTIVQLRRSYKAMCNQVEESQGEHFKLETLLRRTVAEESLTIERLKANYAEALERLSNERKEFNRKLEAERQRVKQKDSQLKKEREKVARLENAFLACSERIRVAFESLARTQQHNRIELCKKAVHLPPTDRRSSEDDSCCYYEEEEILDDHNEHNHHNHSNHSDNLNLTTTNGDLFSDEVVAVLAERLAASGIKIPPNNKLEDEINNNCADSTNNNRLLFLLPEYSDRFLRKSVTTTDERTSSSSSKLPQLNNMILSSSPSSSSASPAGAARLQAKKSHHHHHHHHHHRRLNKE